MTRRVRSRQSAKVRVTTGPLVRVMSQRTSHLHQRERRRPNLPTVMRVILRGGEDEVEEGRGESGSDGDDVDVDGDDGDGDEESNGGTSEGPGDNRPFILPEDWAINKFSPMMSDNSP